MLLPMIVISFLPSRRESKGRTYIRKIPAHLFISDPERNPSLSEDSARTDTRHLKDLRRPYRAGGEYHFFGCGEPGARGIGGGGEFCSCALYFFRVGIVGGEDEFGALCVYEDLQIRACSNGGREISRCAR